MQSLSSTPPNLRNAGTFTAEAHTMSQSLPIPGLLYNAYLLHGRDTEPFRRRRPAPAPTAAVRQAERTPHCHSLPIAIMSAPPDRPRR